MNKINLIFPVAGEASRFGGAFKPFLKIGDITFIETTFKPFEKWLDNINKVYFICTEEQEKNYNISAELKQILPYSFIETVIIDEKTNGPYQTLRKGIAKSKISGPSIVCDCDHSLNVDKIFQEALNKEAQCIIPTWDITKDEWMNWSKVVLDGEEVKMICEKERIYSDDYEVKGIIGCVYFDKIEDKFKREHYLYVSDCLQQLLKQNKKIVVTDTDWASFYGDKKMLENHVNHLRKKCSIFCDIDGVLIHHHPHSTPDPEKNKPLKDCEKLGEWKNSGHRIILTTARSEKYRERTAKLLEFLNINYDQLVMGLPAGPRILINDHKPSKEFANQANAIELLRNSGIGDIDIFKYQKETDTVIEKTFDGGSFAKTYLIKNNVVRKHIIKNKTNMVHYEKLKRQVRDLERFSFLWNGSAPKVLDQRDTDFDFSFDMEYLEGYFPLSDIKDKEKQKKAITKLLVGMEQNVYQLKKETDGIAWLQNHYDKKIFSKFESYSKDEQLEKIINDNYIRINDKVYLGLKSVLLKIDKHLVKPNFIRPIHGDFTLENIMCDEHANNIKLIDMDGSDIFDAAELDLGKMCQSIFSKFDEWKNCDPLVSFNKTSNYSCLDKYFDLDYGNDFIENIVDQWRRILRDDRNTVFNKGIFYMCMYFIRFVPFRMKVSRDHGIFALLMAVVWLNKIHKNEN